MRKPTFYTNPSRNRLRAPRSRNREPGEDTSQKADKDREVVRGSLPRCSGYSGYLDDLISNQIRYDHDYRGDAREQGRGNPERGWINTLLQADVACIGGRLGRAQKPHEATTLLLNLLHDDDANSPVTPIPLVILSHRGSWKHVAMNRERIPRVFTFWDKRSRRGDIPV
jgi:hypothetical protein